MQHTNPIAIIGAGPAGLMAAETLANAGFTVDVFDAMPSPGRKFLLAGVGGMNITHSEEAARFLTRYGHAQPYLAPMLAQFGAVELCNWVHALGIETFVGSSGRVFPKEMKAAPLLRAWLHRLKASGVRIHARHRWLGWDDAGRVRLATPDGEEVRQVDATILALGGGSWAKLGSDGRWVETLAAAGIEIAPLQPSNCGFDAQWSEHFAGQHAGAPMKAIAAAASESAPKKVGEFVITASGVEGNLVYALSAALREEIHAAGFATLYLDLIPQKPLADVLAALKQPRGADSMSNHLRRKLRLEGVRAALLRECTSKETFADMEKLAAAIKSLPVRLVRPRPLDEAISTAGGVMWHELDANLMLKKRPGVFCAGEMLDWEAPTGGYLLTGCFASGVAAGRGVASWLLNNQG